MIRPKAGRFNPVGFTMRILQINKYFYLRGGSERYMFEVSSLLAKAGHDVIHLSMRDGRNEPSPWSDRFLPNIDYREKASPGERLRHAAQVIWNREAYRTVIDLVRAEKVDVAHIHNIAHQLSGSVVAALARTGTPMLHTLHDYKIVCPAYRIFRDGKRCESCRGHRYWNAVRHRCLLDSRPASAVAALEASLYSITGLYRKNVDLFHAPSLFMKRTMERWGLEGGGIAHLPYTIDLAEYEPGGADEGYFLFAGRLSAEKGLDTLLDAAERLRDVPIVVAGDGPLRERCEARTRDRGLASVRFAGHLGFRDLAKAMRGCRALLLPSDWDDNSPLVIYESFAYGKPVIGSDRGGIPEMVLPGRTGLLFPAGDGKALATAIGQLNDRPDRAREMGEWARELMETEYGPERHLERIVELYRRAMGA